MTPEQWEFREAQEGYERAEKMRYAERQNKRETRAVTLVALAAIAAFTVVILFGMRGCSEGADRAHETEMACIAAGGSWVGAPDNTCTHGKGDNE